ncbi:unnamed protein product, partial [Rotaria socialis]
MVAVLGTEVAVVLKNEKQLVDDEADADADTWA